MTLTTALLLVLVGIVLLLVEILVIPGTGVVGIIGLLFLIVGVYAGYTLPGNQGHYVLTVSIVASGGLAYLALKPGTWNRFSVNSNILGKTNLTDVNTIKVGIQGETTTRVQPMGTARFDAIYVEVSAYGDWIEAGSKVEVVQVEGNKIFVKAL